MPQLPFVQTMAVAGLTAIALVVLAMPTGAWLGARAGLRVLRFSLAGVAVTFIGCIGWGALTGDLAVFNARMGFDDWLQMGAFFGIVYITGYRFVAAYLTDKLRADRPGSPAGDAKTTGGADA
ncbi:hypothetical protein [Anaerosoma tenue]|uniref:hypothetical protein n=1 Tax=Anaerosoma tenue TaxID=2933588 RepID=UPI002260A553|nr:hypothetical protein [Anaerosoma tenue]MCK8115543.1 hypothetical protein [Anaerosoma tenue]